MNAGSPSPREAGRETAGHALDTVVLDVGGVLLDWDPRHLYRKLIPDPTHMEDFLARICTAEWHAQHDLGAPFTTTIPPLVRAHPEWTAEIEAWGERFPEMWAGPVEGTVEILNELRGDGVPVYAATNWGADNWTTGNDLFDCLHLFDGALVSGQVGIMKPDPRFFDLLVERFSLDPSSTLFVDDHAPNVSSACSRGFVGHHFAGSRALARELRRFGLLG